MITHTGLALDIFKMESWRHMGCTANINTKDIIHICASISKTWVFCWRDGIIVSTDILLIHIGSQVETRQSQSYKFQRFATNWNFRILQKLYIHDTFWSCLIRCIDMKCIQQALLKIQRGHDSVHRRTDGQTDWRKTWNQDAPLSTSLKQRVWWDMALRKWPKCPQYMQQTWWQTVATQHTELSVLLLYFIAILPCCTTLQYYVTVLLSGKCW